VARAEATLTQSGRLTILFVDEVHRFNKAQQDAFLPYVERGTVTFIGATTENPSFEVIAHCCRARRSMCSSRAPDDLSTLAERALGLAAPGMPIEAPARDALIAYADGDGRRLINLVEQLAVASADAKPGKHRSRVRRTTIARSLRRFDKGASAYPSQTRVGTGECCARRIRPSPPLSNRRQAAGGWSSRRTRDRCFPASRRRKRPQAARPGLISAGRRRRHKRSMHRARGFDRHPERRVPAHVPRAWTSRPADNGSST